jgi:hypothetical protein
LIIQRRPSAESIELAQPFELFSVSRDFFHGAVHASQYPKEQSARSISR